MIIQSVAIILFEFLAVHPFCNKTKLSEFFSKLQFVKLHFIIITKLIESIFFKFNFKIDAILNIF